MSRKVLGVLVAGGLAIGASSAGAWPGCDFDEVTAAVQGDALVVTHRHAVYNCCMDSTTYAVTQGPGTILIEETEAVTIPCLCLCCFDLSVEVGGLAPGEYTLVFTWYDYDTGQPEQWTTQITVSGPGGGPFVAGVTNSGCLDPNDPSSPGVESGSWGRVKTLYE